MIERTKWIHLKRGLNEEGIEVSDLDIPVRKYFLCKMIITNMKNVNAKRFASTTIALKSAVVSMIHILKSRFSPEFNQIIFKDNTTQQTYQWLVDNIGRIDLRMRSMEEEIMKDIRPLLRFDRQMAVLGMTMDIYISLCSEIFMHMIYYPLKRAYLMYKGASDFKIGEDRYEKNDLLFWYLVFVQYFHASEVLGSLTAQKMGNIPKNLGLITKAPSRQIKKSQPTIGIGEFIASEPEQEETVDELFGEMPQTEEYNAYDI